MENTKANQRKVHPQEKGNFLKHLFFCWQIPIFVKGWKKELDENDLYAPLKTHNAKFLGDKIEKLWFLEKKSQKNPSLLKVLVKMFGLEGCVYGLLYLPASLIVFLGKPILLGKILDYFTPGGNDVSMKEAYIYAALIPVITFLYVLFYNFMLVQMGALGMKVRIACASLLYRHILELGKIKIQQITTGHIVNLLANDAGRFDDCLIFFHFVWIGPLQVILAVGYVYVTLDYQATTAIGVLLVLLLFEIIVSLQISTYRSRIAERTDQRLHLVNDAILGFEVIKMHSWEKPFIEMIRNARRLEVEEIKKSNFFRFMTAIFSQLSSQAIFVVVIILVLMDLPLSPQYIYPLTNICTDLMQSALLAMPYSMFFLSEFLVSLKRIQTFLLTHCDDNVSTKRTQNVGVYLEDVNAKFEETPVLKNISFTATFGELVGVVGRAGSGKSTLLQLILGEVEIVGGCVSVEGDVSYASQDPWIFSSSIRQNIIFGEEFDSERYFTVVRVCALERDLSLFPYGDQTLVGEKGVMLSGGQKSRINLARAVYKNADIYLLDDPLSAVDAHVAKHIFEECITKFLKSKCVILVTHQVQFLQNVTKTYFLESGEIVTCGEYNFRLTNNNERVSKAVEFKQNEIADVTKEHRSGGSNINVYKRYCQAAGHWCFTFAVILLFAICQSFMSFLDYFLSFWVNNDSHLTFSERRNFLVVYAVLTAALVVALYVTVSTLAEFFARCSKNLHNKLLSAIMKSPMSFFNHHSSGRILNRFSRDMDAIDETLPIFTLFFMAEAFKIIGLLVVISIINYWMIIMAAILAVTVFFGVMVFQPTNRNLKRTEGVTRSFVYSHLTSTLQGLTTIKAFKAEQVLCEEFDRHQDLHASASYLIMSTFGAFGFWAALVSVVYVAVLVFSLLSLPFGSRVASVGLAVSLATTLADYSPYLVKDWGEIETKITSVERITEYIDLDPEDDVDSVVLPKDWPSKGDIHFDSVSMKYSPNKPLVLKNVTFRILPGEKIGIVGRTGAGKTSLISALFRLFSFEGSILIDGLDTKFVPLNKLRSRISVIPQDPILFLGTLRKNLDPVNEYSDAKLWQVLNELELKTLFSDLPNGLDTEISEGGSNFSVGQRQLLCLVRTMLRESKIIALDEATANVDTATDEMIQKTIRKKFENCTVLTIAHRLNTVIDSDRVLVMDAGTVVEFDSPYTLLKDTQSYFYGLVAESGAKVFKELTDAAKKQGKVLEIDHL